MINSNEVRQEVSGLREIIERLSIISLGRIDELEARLGSLENEQHKASPQIPEWNARPKFISPEDAEKIKAQAGFAEKVWDSAGEVCRDIRLALSITRVAASGWMGVSQTSLRKFENGGYTIYREMFLRCYKSFILGVLEERRRDGRWSGEFLDRISLIISSTWVFVESTESEEWDEAM